MRKIADWLKHTMNAQHVYCRLRDTGMSKRLAKAVSYAWEKLASRLLYAIVVVMFLVVGAWAREAKVVAVHDGDTVRLDSGESVRLAGI